MPLLSAFARAFGTVLVAVPVAAAVPAVANPPVPAVAPAAAPTDEDNTVPIISSVRIRPAEPVLGGKAPTKVTVDVRVGDSSGVDSIEAWLHTYDGLDGRELKSFVAVPGVKDLFRASLELSKHSQTGRWNTDFFMADNVNNMALRRSKAPFWLKRDTRFQGVNASPERVKRGARITVRGELVRFDPAKGYVTHGDGRVQILFKRKGRTRWVEMGYARTDRSGAFMRAFPARADGAWRAAFAGTRAYVARISRGDGIDVR